MTWELNSKFHNRDAIYIVVYDISSKKWWKIYKYLKRYLNHIQLSVFQGELKYTDYLELEELIQNTIDFVNDSVIIFQILLTFWVNKKIIWYEKNTISNFL